MTNADDSHQALEYPAMTFVSRLSVASWEISGRLPGASLWLPPVKAFMKLIRPGRVLMVSMLTWVIAFASGVPTPKLWSICLAGMFLAMAGFALDMYTDRDIDRHGGRTWPVNPLAAGMMTGGEALFFAVGCAAAGLVLLFAIDVPTALASLLALLVYNGLYTPIKKYSSLALFPGAISGALPVAAGWLALAQRSIGSGSPDSFFRFRGDRTGQHTIIKQSYGHI